MCGGFSSLCATRAKLLAPGDGSDGDGDGSDKEDDDDNNNPYMQQLQDLLFKQINQPIICLILCHKLIRQYFQQVITQMISQYGVQKCLHVSALGKLIN